ncbi:MAG: UDP-N-acetylmuramoyl-tripeptide--D-alanyl-D-alanine ligase [Bacillota bacterium]
MMPPLILVFMLVLHVLLWMRLSVKFVHLMQLESYQNRMYVKALRRNLHTLLLPILAAGALSLAAGGAVWLLIRDGFVAAVAAPFSTIAIGLLLVIMFAGRRQKKPLVYTARVKRLLASVFVVSALYAWVAWALWGGLRPLVAFELVLAAGMPFVPVFVLLGAAVNYPFEQHFKRRYFNEAKQKLAACDNLIKIGITGSFGKTSAKHMLGTILQQRYKTLITPQSYNTPMGVSRVIRENPVCDYEVFVCEMGARYKGDIRELCDLVQPRYGLITSIGKQHLETFKTLDTVISTKYELIEALPENGCAFFPSDNEICLELFEKTAKNKALFGFDGQGRVLDMAVDEYQTGPEGSTFALIGQDGSKKYCSTRLLGRHNVQNILGAACVAQKLGLTLDEIAQGIALIEPVEHRLQLIQGANGVTVIDDAFNANPEGAEAALEVIASFEGGKKIIVTPGLVELGKEEEELNRAFGRSMAACVDEVILVGGAMRTAPLLEGIEEAGFDREHIHVVADLEGATAVIGRIARTGDVVLFENDLPDNYNG